VSQQTIPLTTEPNQTLTQALTVDGQSLTLQLVLRYNEVARYWVMSVLNAQGVLLVDSVPLITGNEPICNILKQYSYLKIGSCFILNVSGNSSPNYPNKQTLGTSFLAVWGDTP